jgi:hypothetical protein
VRIKSRSTSASRRARQSSTARCRGIGPLGERAELRLAIHDRHHDSKRVDSRASKPVDAPPPPRHHGSESGEPLVQIGVSPRLTDGGDGDHQVPMQGSGPKHASLTKSRVRFEPFAPHPHQPVWISWETLHDAILVVDPRTTQMLTISTMVASKYLILPILFWDAHVKLSPPARRAPARASAPSHISPTTDIVRSAAGRSSGAGEE